MVERLPEYERPPVVEVAVSLQFESPVLSGPQLMLLGSQVRDRFPVFEQVVPLPATLETFERPKAARPRIEFQVSDALPIPRMFMVNESGTALLQVQQDRFGYNWRKLKPEHAYPRYAAIRDAFVKEFAHFEEFLAKERLGNIAPTQCEVTYVNHILSEGVWERHGELYKVIPSVTPRLSENFLPIPEDVQFVSRYVITDKENKPLARLYVHVEPRYLPSGMEPIFLMRLTVRGVPQGTGLPGLLTTMELGHEWIVRGFTTLTSPEMHKAWRRTR